MRLTKRMQAQAASRGFTMADHAKPVNWEKWREEQDMTTTATTTAATAAYECINCDAPVEREGMDCGECDSETPGWKFRGEATARPWRRFGGMVDGYGICDANGKVLIPRDAFNGLNQYGDEILRAVNNYDALVAALEDVELRLCQTRLASTIGRKNQADFLRNEIERIQGIARAAFKLAEEGNQQ